MSWSCRHQRRRSRVVMPATITAGSKARRVAVIMAACEGPRVLSDQCVDRERFDYLTLELAGAIQQE
jgi:hypothetical protein